MTKRFLSTELISLGLWSLYVVVFLGPVCFSIGAASWEGLGDAHFYAASAWHWFEYGENRWFELYPISLKQGSGVHMSFGAPGHSLLTALLVWWGLEPRAGTMWLSVIAFCGLCSSLYLWGQLKCQSKCAAWALGLAPLALPQGWSWAVSGGSDSLGQLGLLCSSMGLIACCCSETRFKRERLPCVYVFIFGMMAVWALVRPQNQLLLLGSLVLLPWVQRRGAWFLSWLCGLVVWKGLQAILLGQGGLVFPYSFSFWVGTSVFPNHDLFREYHSSGFSIDQMMAMSGLLLEKLSVGWSFLKQYWSSWLPHLLLCVLALWNRVSRPIALVLLFLHLSTIGLSAMGHLVPRYWEVLEVLLLLLLMVNLDVLRGGLKEWGPVIILVLVVLGIGLDSARVAPLRDSWLRPRQIHSLELPYSIREQLRGDHWVASDHPAAVVDAIQRPILLLPNRAEQLFEINREVKLMKSIVFTPKLEFGELSNWSSQLDVLEQYGYRCVVSIGGWRLWRLMGTKNEGC